MSALTDLFTAMANKIRSKTGTQTTYTPSEMVSDGIDDVYDAGVASVPTPTSITPSNASPVSLTANTAVKPTAAGYAIESYGNITPSGTSATSVSAGSLYKINTNNGQVIKGYTTKTPSDSNPPSMTINNFYKVGSNGYLVRSLPINLLAPDKYWQGNISGSGSQTITVTQKPRYVIFMIAQYGATNGYSGIFIFDAQNITGIYYRYQSSGYTNGDFDDASGWLTSVTASSITVKNNMSSTVRAAVIIYY